MKKLTFAVGCAGVFLVSIACIGAQIGDTVDAAAWLQEDLSENTPSVTFSGTSDALAVQFYQKGSGIPPAIAAGLGADVSVMAGVVVGDYRDVEGLSFRASRVGGMMADVMVVLTGASGTEWNQRATQQLSKNDGESCAVNISLDPSLWKYGGSTADSSARWLSAWNRDLQNVTGVRLVITHVGFAAEEVSVSNFRLLGEGFISDPAKLQLVKQHFDADISNADELTAAQKAQDSDRNGKSDLMQLLDDEEPGLHVEIVGVDTEGRARVRWPAVKGRRYRLERTQDLTLFGDCEIVPIDSPVADQAGDMERTDNSVAVGDGPYFYRAVKE